MKNKLFIADDLPEMPPVPNPLPELPVKKGIDANTIIASALAGIFLIVAVHFFIVDSQPRETNLKVFVEQQNVSVSTTTVPKNNIQASHIANLYTIQNGSRLCVVGDDSGDLWGSSMQPTFFEGNTVLLRNYSLNMTLHTGDLVRYFRLNSSQNCSDISKMNNNTKLGSSWIPFGLAVIHRINAIYDEGIVVQGDNVEQFEVIQPCQITDVVIGILYT
jgi:hypothetical protein